MKDLNIIIETERFFLREIVEEDVHDFFELDSNPKVHTYLGNNPVKTLEESAAQIRNILDQYEKNGIGRLAIIDKNSTDLIGWSGLKYETSVRQEFNYYDLGYRLKEQYWGKGIATETAIASLNYGFRTLNLEEICGAADKKHGASNAILKKIGLQPGEEFIYDGEVCNWYSLKKADWESHLIK